MGDIMEAAGLERAIRGILRDLERTMQHAGSLIRG